MTAMFDFNRCEWYTLPMSYRYLLVIIVCCAFLCASMGLCDEAAGESHDDTHHCIASCSAACCKTLVQDDGFTAPPSFTASSVFVPAQIVYHNLVVRSIKHPPKRLV